MGQRGYGKAQRGSCHGRLSGQAALLELCYLSTAESQPAERGGAHTALSQDTHCEEAFYQACVFCGQSQTRKSFNIYIISFIFSITFFTASTCLLIMFILPILITWCCWVLSYISLLFIDC